MNASTPQGRAELAALYRSSLVDDVIPFWIKHGLDRQHGGILTALDRDGSLLDDDKSIWFQGRAGWMFATLYRTVEPRPEWHAAAESCLTFLRRFGRDPQGKFYFSVTRDGRPLRIRRYAYSESFAAIALAAWSRIGGDSSAADEALRCFESFLHYSFDPAASPPKVDPQTRPLQGIGPLMIGMATAQELRENLGEVVVRGRSCSGWIDWFIERIERCFLKPQQQVLMEVVGPAGEICDHFDGRLLNPGHALEAAWFILHEGRQRGEERLVRMGLSILDWMWQRGWDEQYGGLFYFRDLAGKPVQEYWHDMKFWWPHCEAIIATLLAAVITGEERYFRWHEQVHDWTFRHFPDPQFGEWFGYLHRDGRLSVPLKGNLWKGPFHIPRMLWYCHRLLTTG